MRVVDNNGCHLLHLTTSRVKMGEVPTPNTPRSGRRFRGLSAEQRTEQRRQRLIEAGVEVFGTRGFHGSGVRDICSEAGLTERYFYESFSNREALFLAVYDHSVARLRRAIVGALEVSKPDVTAMARAGLRAFLETIHADPRLARVVLLDVFTVGVEVGMQSIAATRTFADLVGTVVRAIHPDAIERRGFDGLIIADGLVGSTVFIVVQWVSNGFEQPLDRVLEHCLVFYEAMSTELLSGLRPG